MKDREPTRYEVNRDDPKTELRDRVVDALYALPHYFKSQVHIEGLPATDLFSLNTLLGSAIENQAVAILNELRAIWDPEKRWFDYSFIRFPESYPDVRLVRDAGDTEPAIGIELKGWYLLSKEKEPSFRYKASADANTVWDLIVCYPWYLSNVLSGVPVLAAPYVEQAKYVADMRTYYWEHRKGSNAARSNEIIRPETKPYPAAGSKSVDTPKKDSGNFGRIARIPGLTSEWIEKSLSLDTLGIEARHWIMFFSAFVERKTSEDVETALQKLRETIKSVSSAEKDDAKLAELIDHIYSIVDIFMLNDDSRL